MLYCFILCCVVLHCALSYCVVFCFILCYVVLCFVILCCIVLCYVMLCYVMMCCIVFCCVMLYCVVLCFVVLCCVVLCYVVLCCWCDSADLITYPVIRFRRLHQSIELHIYTSIAPYTVIHLQIFGELLHIQNLKMVYPCPRTQYRDLCLSWFKALI